MLEVKSPQTCLFRRSRTLAPAVSLALEEARAQVA
jgi:hypothetical protein